VEEQPSRTKSRGVRARAGLARHGSARRLVYRTQNTIEAGRTARRRRCGRPAPWPPVRPAKTKTAAAALRWYAARRGSVIDGRKRPGARRRLPHHSLPRPNNRTALTLRSRARAHPRWCSYCYHPVCRACLRCTLQAAARLVVHVWQLARYHSKLMLN